MTQQEIIDYIKNNKENLRAHRQGFLDGDAKVGDSDAVKAYYQPRIDDVALCNVDSWYNTEDDALKVGQSAIEWAESQ